MEATTTSIDYDTNLDMAMPTGIESMNTDIMMGGSDTLMMVGAGLNILTIVLYLLQTTGLFLINKKLGEKHAWLSFVPLLQIYNYFTASKAKSEYYLLLPLLALIIGFILSFFTFGISLILVSIYILIMWIKLLHKISVRCNRGVWTTIGFIFIPWIMMPVVGYKLGTQPNETNSPEEKTTEEKIEL